MKRHLFAQSRQTRHFLTGTLFALSILATGGPAAAIDGKTLQGAACQPLDQTQTYSADGSGRIFNPSTTQHLFVNCPVVRDTIGGHSNGIDEAFVKVIDNNPAAGKEVVCTLFSFRGDNGQVVEAISRSSVGSNPNVQTLPTFVDLASTSGGYYNLLCNIPPRPSAGFSSGIVMYQVNEQD